MFIISSQRCIYNMSKKIEDVNMSFSEFSRIWLNEKK